MSRRWRALWAACGALVAVVGFTSAACAPIDTPGPEHLDAEEADDPVSPPLIDAGRDAALGDDGAILDARSTSCPPDGSAASASCVPP